MATIVVIIVSVCVIAAVLAVCVSACMLSSRISQEEEKRMKNKED